MKPKAVISLFLGELFWEFARFTPHIIYKRKKLYKDRKDIEFICATREDRFDLYSDISNILVPLRILGDGDSLLSNCYRLDNFPEIEYENLIKTLKNQFSDRYDIIETIYPKIDKNNFSNKKQFNQREHMFKYSPRNENKKLIDDKIITDKKIVVLAPRYRKGMKRNWAYWQELYDMIYSNKNLINKYEFVICGKYPDCIPDKYYRFLDINNFPKTKDTSLIGLTIEIMKKAYYTIGSQSGIPNISLLFNVPALEWGHQKRLHTIDYNIHKTKVTFLEDMKYCLKPEIIYKEIIKVLK